MRLTHRPSRSSRRPVGCGAGGDFSGCSRASVPWRGCGRPDPHPGDAENAALLDLPCLATATPRAAQGRRIGTDHAAAWRRGREIRRSPRPLLRVPRWTARCSVVACGCCGREPFSPQANGTFANSRRARVALEGAAMVISSGTRTRPVWPTNQSGPPGTARETSASAAPMLIPGTPGCGLQH